MSTKKDLIEETGKYTFSTVLGKLLSIPHSIIVAKYLGPEMLGLFAIYKLIISYSSYSQLGQLQTLSRQIPIAYSENNFPRGSRIKNTLFSSYLLTMLITSIIIGTLIKLDFILPNFFKNNDLIILLLIVLASQSNAFLRNYIKAEGEFHILANFSIIEKVFRPILGMLLIIWFGLKGAIFNLLVMSLMTLAYYYIKLNNVSFKFALNLSGTLKLIKPGFLLFVNKIISSLFWNIDLLIISALMTKSDIGFYSLALGLFVSLGVFTRAIGMHIYRKILMRSKLAISIEEKYGFIISNNSIFLLYNTIIFGVSSLIYIGMIETVLTDYGPSKILIVILCFGYTVFIARENFGYYMDASNQLIKRLVILIIGLIINATLDLVLILNGYGLIGASFACVLGFMTIAYLTSYISLRQITKSSWFAVSYIFRHFMITIILSIVILYYSQYNLFEIFVFDTKNSYSFYINNFFNVAFEIFTFILLSTLFYIVIFKEDNIPGKLKSYIKIAYPSQRAME